MRKSTISLAVAATVAASSAAQAGQYLNPGKTGQVLLFPFYNADSGNNTLMHLTNTTAEVKAVKVRFLEYKNSDSVLDFNLYLSPKDQFTFVVQGDANGDGAAILTADKTCTVPALGTSNGEFPGTVSGSLRTQPFHNFEYASDADSSIERTLTGHVQVIEMGVVSGETYAAAATHDAAGKPADCEALDEAWQSGGGWADDASDGISAPTGGLSGTAYHFNVDAAAAVGFGPTTIDGFSPAAQHTNPGSADPSITSGTKVATVQNNGAWIDYTLGSGVEATSALLQTASLSNDVMVNDVINGSTDWVVTFPTKRAHVDVAAKADVVPPFTDNWVGSPEESAACEPASLGQWDQESSAAAMVETSICNGTAVIAMSATYGSALKASAGVTELAFAYTDGWAQLSFDDASQSMTLAGGASRQGLPAIGFAAYQVLRSDANYGFAVEHKTEITSSGI